MKYHVISIMGKETSHCPFAEVKVCGLTAKDCNYGLTDVGVPDHCPLLGDGIVTKAIPTRHARWHRGTEQERLHQELIRNAQADWDARDRRRHEKRDPND